MFFQLRKEMRREINYSWLKKKSKFLAFKTLKKMKLIDGKLFFLINEYAGQNISYDVSKIILIIFFVNYHKLIK